MVDKLQGPWTDKQIKYIHFLARGKRNKKGLSRTEEQFSKAIGVDFSTLWRWKQLPGFKTAVLEVCLGNYTSDIPVMVQGQMMKAKGVEPYAIDKKGNRKVLKPDTNAFNAVMKLFGMTPADKVESTVHHSGGLSIDLSSRSNEDLEAIVRGDVVA